MSPQSREPSGDEAKSSSGLKWLGISDNFSTDNKLLFPLKIAVAVQLKRSFYPVAQNIKNNDFGLSTRKNA